MFWTSTFILLMVCLVIGGFILGGRWILYDAERRERGLPDHWAIKWFIRVSFVVVFVNGVRASIWLVFGYRLF
jgi:TRAP-type mannitol/chloroaromatic compound transport system permease small subunit